MRKVISTYEELLIEEQRLTNHLASFKGVLKSDVDSLKESLNPIKRIKDKARSLFTRENNGPLLNFGINFSLDLLVKRLLLARANWLLKFAVPYLMKNYASHLITEEQRQSIIKSIAKLIRKVAGKKAKEKFEETQVAT